MTERVCGCLLVVVLLSAASMIAHADEFGFAISGVDGELEERLVAHLNAAFGARDDLSDARIRALHRRAPRLLREALEALGYYDAIVTPDLTRDGTTWKARYAVAAGPPVAVLSLTLELHGAALEDPVFARYREEFPLQPGARLQHAAYEAGKRALLDRLAERGYFDAEISTSEVTVDKARHEAAIRLLIDSGRRYNVGAVRWPETVLAPSFLDRYLGFEPGQAFLGRDLLELQSRLADSNYFSSVQVAPRRDLAADGSVPVDVTLEPRKPYRYGIGAGFGTDTGVRGRASFQRPYLNPQGHRFESDLKVSRVLSNLNATYLIPLRHAYTDSLAFNAGATYEDTDVAKSSKLETGVAHLTTRFGWKETLGLSYEFEKFDIGNKTTSTGLLVPNARWTRTWTDNPVYTTDGLRVGLGLRGATDSLLSAVSFGGVTVDAKFVRALGDTRLITRGQFGALFTSNFDRLPPTERYFAGGDNSIRGFGYRELGPRDANDKVIGGRYLVVGSVELDHRIKGNWRGAVFSDFGNALDSLSDPIAYSVGAGVRWLSPIGLVRVDFACGISDSDYPWQFHVVVGPDL